MVELKPIQMAAGDADAVTTGVGFTVKVAFAVLEQPCIEVPVTVYVVVAEGDALNELPVPDGLQA